MACHPTVKHMIRGWTTRCGNPYPKRNQAKHSPQQSFWYIIRPILFPNTERPG